MLFVTALLDVAQAVLKMPSRRCIFAASNHAVGCLVVFSEAAHFLVNNCQ